MLKNDVIWPPHRQYTSRTEWEPIGFFSDGLCNAQSFDLMLGFFSSSAIHLLAYSFASFIHGGGKMRLIINDILSLEDKGALTNGVNHLISSTFDLSNLDSLKTVLSQRDKHFFDCLSYLISENRIDIKIIRPKGGNGISHTKLGVFSDGVNKVAFSGSCNFSYCALVENLEHISASCEWDGKIDQAKITSIESRFESVFNETDTAVEYLPVNSITTNIKATFPRKEIQQLLADEERLIANVSDLPPFVADVLNRVKSYIEQKIEALKKNAYDVDVVVERKPAFPYPSGPREYQNEAFMRWRQNNQTGLFAMATGTGKTITSLNCLLEIYNRFGYYKAIILVPTITLVDQWEKECFKFHFDNVIKVCSKNPAWKEELAGIRFQERFQGAVNTLSYVIISTYASFTKAATFEQLADFPKNQVLLIADEAHNMGANNLKKLLSKVPYLRRMGLSATPDRQFDDSGNKSISTFFGIKPKEYTFEYTMAEAIEKGVLCRYFYYPHIVRLTDDEMERYVELSVKIAKYFSVNQDSFVSKDPILTALLLKRKRIIHKAVNKLEVFREILLKHIEVVGSLKYTLVYVPEGNKPDDADADMFTYTDVIRDDEVSDHLIDIYSKVICEIEPHVTVKKFTSDSSDRDIMLRDFAEGKLDVLTSMKCLDEGVDVPRSELAIFCASTGNPRQFIQRRGRILRQHKDKKYAIIHDLIVAPEISPYSDSFQMERSLLNAELRRVNNFALLSENPAHTCMALNDVMSHYGLSLFNNNIK